MCNIAKTYQIINRSDEGVIFRLLTKPETRIRINKDVSHYGPKEFTIEQLALEMPRNLLTLNQGSEAIIPHKEVIIKDKNTACTFAHFLRVSGLKSSVLPIKDNQRSKGIK